MSTRYRHSRGLVACLGLLAAACAPAAPAAAPAPVGLPAIPRVEGALAVRVVHPTPSTPRPGVDSTYIYGSVGTGEAALTINGAPVEVEPNGAFLAYLPVPEDGAWRLEATARGRTEASTVSYRMPPPPPAGPPSAGGAPRPAVEEIAPAAPGTVTGGADTLATGSDVAIGRPAPGGSYRWFLPRGARVAVTGRLGDQVRVQLGDSVGWFPAADVTLGEGAAPPARLAGSVEVRGGAGWTDLRLPVGGAPFQVEAGDSAVTVTLFGVQAPGEAPRVEGDPLLSGAAWAAAGSGSARLRLGLRSRLWGYKAFYEPDGTLVLRLRRPPEVDPASPLRGRRIAIDPGHPPGGATGPTGLTEAEANLAIALRLAERLRARGAEVLLTRSDARSVPLGERVQRAVAWDAELLVSVHNNAFAEGVDPRPNAGTSVYYFHPFSAGLARSLDQNIVRATRVRDLGARWSNLALARTTWMPSALTESLFMLIPEHEAALRDPAFVDRLAAAHAEGIEEFLRR